MLLTLFASLAACLVSPASAQIGREVENVASVTFETSGVAFSLPTNRAVFTVEAARTPSTIDFFRYAPTAPDAIQARVRDSHFSPSGAVEGPFSPVGPPVTVGDVELDFSGQVPLVPAAAYLPGELIILRVVDAGQNGDPERIETVVITVAAESGDLITLCLFESGPDTGEFFAWLPTTGDPAANADNTLLVGDKDQLTATYVDVFDATEISIDTALVDPFGRVFNSLTGELINGAVVTIIDDATGLPAEVFGVDGVSAYPSTVTTGGVVTDASGLVYDLPEGEFLFPLMAPGVYRIEVAPPDGLFFPSAQSPDSFSGLPNAPFDIIPASFGGTFVLDASGPINFDAPVDPFGEVVIQKEASNQTVSPGGFVEYEILIENRNEVALPLLLQDALPRGFRYRPGTARVDGAVIPEPAFSPDGSVATFRPGLVPAGGAITLSYVTEVGAGAPLGDAINTAQAVNGAGEPVSNTAQALVFVQEDLLRSRLAIIGRVAVDACDPDEDWPRDIKGGEGVPGVRFYLEDGEFTVSDRDGLFHFEDVLPGTHVVQLDEATLPPGFEPVACEQHSRFAGSATSQFVDAQGGSIWRADFYLKRTEEAIEAAAEAEAATATPLTGPGAFDQAWLDAQAPVSKWAYPSADTPPSSRSVNIGIAHAEDDRVRLYLNGERVPGLNFSGRQMSTDQTVQLSRWRGVDILEGENVFEAEVIAPDGSIRDVLTESIWFSKEIRSVALVADQSQLVADGRTRPVIAVSVAGAAGRSVHGGRALEVEISAPYRLGLTADFEDEAPIAGSFSTQSAVSVGADGIARIELEPTLKTGLARLRIKLDDGRYDDIEVYLTPEKRDWILVGLAEGVLGVDRFTSGGADGVTDFERDGRFALFAKGLVRGDWLLTVAVDTAKRRGESDDELFDDIDPNAFYTLYGDRSYQENEAETRYPVYVKLERDTFQALFGDFDTGLTDSVLSRYSRRLSGFQTVYESPRLSFSAFAAETNQGFAQDEFPADGTSGPFRLTNAPLVRNSEVITVETRDRFRPDQILEQRTFARFLDYDIDFDTGEILFRQPVNATDAAFNPNVIVVDYEARSDAERNVTAGGRAAARFVDGAVELGATYIREEGSPTAAGGAGELAGVDLRARLGDRTEARFEFAASDRGEDGETEDADAVLAEIVHQSQSVSATAYFRQDDGDFGLDQQTSAVSNIRRYGAAASVLLSESRTGQNGQRSQRVVETEAYREDNLATGDSRTVGEAEIRHDSATLGLGLGLRGVQETFEDETRTSVLVTGSARKTFVDAGLTLLASHEQPIAGEDESTLFPQRTTVGVDKTLTSFATLNVRHEALNGADASGQNTVAGVTVKPWSGGEFRASADMLTQDSGRRLGATVGVDQAFELGDGWSTGFGAARRARIDGGDDERDVTPDAALSPLETAPQSPLTSDDEFTSGYAGVGYRSESTAASARAEVRDSTLGRRISVFGGAAREATEELSFAGAARVTLNNVAEGDDQREVEARIGLAWRPRGEGPVVYNRLDVAEEEIFSRSTRWKVVNNLGVNANLTDRTELAAFYGVKYENARFGDVEVSGVTQLLGAELRQDITKHIDIGVSGSALHAHGSGTTDFAAGASVGFTPADNVWISLGYNVEGFEDRDFEAAEFTRKGPFVKLRVKFDQNTAGELLRRVAPNWGASQ
ncbi:MAG: hypothetical protein AAFX03_09045 [Pseudomonadota bacterium]